MENLKTKQRDAEMVMISRVLNDMYKATKSGGHFSSLAKLAAPHNLDSKYVSSIKKLQIVLPIHSTQGRRVNTKFQWNKKEIVTPELAERVYEYAHSEQRLKASRETEDAKFMSKIGDKHLSKICHTTLKAPGTVLKFIDEVYKLCPCTFIELFRLTESEDPEETKVNKDIIAYLKKTSFVKEDDLGSITWNDDESPSIELAKAVSADLMTEKKPKEEVKPEVKQEIETQMTTQEETARKPRREDHRTMRLKAEIKMLLDEAATGKTFNSNPLNRFNSANVKMIMKPLLEKLTNGRYRIKPFQESPEEKMQMIYENLQTYQRPILARSTQKKMLSTKMLSTKTVPAEASPAKHEPPKHDELPKTNAPLPVNDVEDLLVAAEELKKLKDAIKQSVAQYKSILMRFGYTDARFSAEIADILK